MMPVLSNPCHELFAQALAKGRTQVDAYAEAGYKPHDSSAARLLGNVRIAARVAELQEKGAERSLVTADSIAIKLDAAYDLAMTNGQTAAAVSASMAIAKLYGLDIDRSRLDVHHHYADMSDDELDRELSQALAGEAVTAH